MPIFVPADVESFVNVAEEDFYRFLERAAKPDDKFVAWHEPKISDASSEKEPDFLIFHPETGLTVIEVKAWAIEQILEATPDYFLLQKGAKKESATNPYLQAKGYFTKLRSRIQAGGRLVSNDPLYRGKCKVPISYGVAFPNILREEFVSDQWDDAIIPRDRILFHEDLAPGSDWHGNFLANLKSRFPIPFPCALSPEEIRHLRMTIFPILQIPHMNRGPAPDRSAHDQRVALLDRAQESLARKPYPGVRLVVGPAGSGKTLVLVHQAAWLARTGVAKRILYLCFNTSVVNHVRRLLAGKGLPTAACRIDVLPFFDLCERLLKDPVPHEQGTREFYDFVVESVLAMDDLGEGNRYDAVMVDEGQDFNTGMLRVAMRCMKPVSGIMTIALDEGQNLYGRDRDWGALGIATKGKVVTQLRESYRATKELTEFSTRFLKGGQDAPQPESDASSATSVQGLLFSVPSPTQGPLPELTRYTSLDEMLKTVAKRIREMHDSGEYSLSEIAVIYSSKQYPAGKEEGLTLPEAVGEALAEVGILSRWIAEDHRARREHDVTTDSVAISTIHSAKGLDHAAVFLLGLDELDPNERRSESLVQRTAYVGLTRARYQLVIPYLRENDLIRKLRGAQGI